MTANTITIMVTNVRVHTLELLSGTSSALIPMASTKGESQEKQTFLEMTMEVKRFVLIWFLV